MRTSPRHRWLFSSLVPVLAGALAVGCGDDGDDTGSGGDATSTSTQTSSGETTATSSSQTTSTSTGSDTATLAAPSAPTRTTIVATFEGTTPPPTDAAAYTITSDRGPLAIESVTADAGVLTLTTEPQKLGVTYELRVTSAGDPYEDQGGSFPAADTAELWATEFEGFTDYLVVARRVAIGEHAVLYVEEGLDASDTEETVAAFDDVIYPIETEVFRAPPDADDNGRIVLLALDGREWYGGYFNPINTLSVEEAAAYGYESNALEIIYFNVSVQPYGFDPGGVVPHEYQHLLYAEEHGIYEDWSWHNEGLGECAVNAVWGANETAEWVYASDYYGDLRTGKSLVQWEYANYSQYVQSYVFLTYAASQLGGVAGFSQLFHTNGDPDAVDDLFQDALGKSFSELQLGALTAAWVQAAEGDASFGGLLELPQRPEIVPGGADEVSLRPYAAVFFGNPGDGIAPVGAGDDVVHRGIDGALAIDDVSPFAAEGGALIALNTRMADLDDQTPQSSGVVGAKVVAALPRPVSPRPLAPQRAAQHREMLRRHAPPVPPGHPAMRAFREATRR